MGGAVSLQSESGEGRALEGAGTESDPYRISSAEELRAFAEKVNGGERDASAVLTDDIDLNPGMEINDDGTVTGNPEEWTPIGNSSQQYSGTFDGNGKTISGLYIDSSDNDQGLFGYVGSSGTVENCYNTGAVNSSGNWVGGVVGVNSGSVTNCYNTGAVSGSDWYVGGVVGWNDRGTVTNCYNTGKVSGNSYVGGVAGGNSSIGTVTGCYFLQGTAGSGIGSGTGSTENVKSLTAEEFADQSKFSSWTDFTDTWEIESIFGRPTLQDNAEIGGTANNPYKIFTATQLENFRDLINGEDGQTADTDAHAVLMNNIDLEGSETNLWTPIGTSSSKPYSGTFDGNGHTISGLYIDSSSDNYQGLFGYLGTSGDNKGTVQNLSVSGTVNSSGDYVGGVVGYNNGGTVTGCIFSGSGSGSVSGYSNAVGGVVGWNDSGANVENCYNTGSVNVISNSSAVGGVVGYNGSSSTVENCYNTGSVTSSDSPVGGVVGYNGSSSTVENCYNTGSVTSSDSPVGGVVGYNISSVTNCYNTGTVSGSGGHVDGVVGDNRGTVKNCYYQIDKGATVGSDGTTKDDTTTVAKTAAEFHSGEVAYLLQSNQTAGSSQVWGQAIGEDKSPVLTSDQEKNVYKVTINLNDSDSTENETRYTNSDLKALTPESRKGYTFDGWYDNKACTGEAVTTITDPITTLYAKWTANTYTVTLHTNDGTIAEGEKLTSYTYGVGAKLPAENKITKTGHTFAGWYNNADLTGDPVIEISATDTGEKEYWAKWTPNTYQVTLHTNDGTIAEGQNVTSYIYGVGAKLPTENEITKTGYIFAGWYNNADLTGDPVTEISKTDINDKAYWAKWEEVENPEPDPTPTPTPDPTPSGPSTGDSSGWDDIRDELENAAKGDEITIDMGDETKVPAEIFESLAGKDVDVTFDLGDIQWSVNGADIPTDTDFTDLDLGASLDTHGIPVNVINTITGEVGTVQITLAHDGEFGFTMTLTAPLGKENAGYWANLYHYDEDAEALNFEAAAKIDEDGSVTIPFSHASQYAIVIDTHSHATVDVSDLFIDIAPDAWYKDAIQYAYDNGLMTGVSATEFDPEATTTRAMIVSILARLEGVTTAEAAGFADVDDNDWYATAVNWAANVGVVNGYEDNTFRPNTAITREQLAAILMNYAAYKGEDVSNRADLTSYTDQPSTWAEEAMSWAVAEGLINGVTADTLQPQGAATRAQVAAILQRFLSERRKLAVKPNVAPS